MVADNPYTTQTNAPSKDHGLWDVIGRAIRSQVPTRENKAFDKTKPVGEGNMPYENPGFFRALAGDRGRDYNNDAMLRQRDLDTADMLEGKNFAGWNKGMLAEDAIEDGNRKDQQGFLERMQNSRNQFQNELAGRHERMQREIADTTGANWLRREDRRGFNNLQVNRYRATHPYSQQIDPSTVRLNNAKAGQLERNMQLLGGEPTGTVPTPDQPTKGNFITRGLKSIFPAASSLTNNPARIKINAADIPGRSGLKPTDMRSSGAVQNGLVPADYDDPSLMDDDDDSDLLSPYDGFNMQY